MTPVTVTEVVVAPARITIPQGERLQFTAMMRDDQDRLVADMAVEWSSADPDIVAIDEDGSAEAVAAGTTTIRASLGNVIGEGRITVISLFVDGDDEDDGEEGDDGGADVGGDDEEDEVNDDVGGGEGKKKGKKRQP